MYLTGQPFARPWQEPKEKDEPLKKTIDFYGNVSRNNDKVNLWDNTYRCSEKLYGYYHFGQKLKMELL